MQFVRNWEVRKGRMRRTVHMLVTPRVREEVRRHFNCSALEGAELEDRVKHMRTQESLSWS